MIDDAAKKTLPNFSGARILVVGGAGFVGSNLVRRLLNDHPEQIVVVDNLLSSDRRSIPDNQNVKFIEASITESEVLRSLPRDLDFAFHLACYHGNQSSIADPIADHDNNTITSLKLFERLKDFKSLTKVVYAAAGCAVAKKTRDEPAATSEDANVELFHDSPYSISKIVGEMYGNYYFRRYKMPFVKARFQNVYGPREILGAGRWRGTPHTVWRNVTPTFIFKALHGEALPLINGGLDGRDFIFVDDLVEGLMRVAAYGSAGEAYNLGSGRETRIRDLASAVNNLTGNENPPDIVAPRDWDNSGRRFGDPTKSRETIGFVAVTPLHTGLKETVAWTRANLDLIKSAIARHAERLPEVRKYV
ncbi:MAG: NAD-dependent epimerase/dehydratase family protein [Pseudolabrys sp.]|nr:NAD-dependent epimerase/dehydratase family protein [Pseudolabrys sp.]